MIPLRRSLFLVFPWIAALGCSVIARSAPDQCATDNDCYVKFGGSYTCRSGACQVATPSTTTTEDPRPKTLEDCRSTQECVAVRGEGWLCRRDRDDPQKKGRCQQLTATNECTIVGDYKHDRVVMLGALLPGSRSPQLDAALRRGMLQAVDDWQVQSRQLAETNTGADAVAPPRPFAILACSEDVPVADLRNLYLNTGVSLVVGPSALRDGTTETLANELTQAKLLLVSPTAVGLPRSPGANVGAFFFRIAGDEKALGDAILGRPRKPLLIIRRTGAYEALANQIRGGSAGSREILYEDPTALATEINDEAVILGDGEAKDLLPRLRQGAQNYIVRILPTALPDVAQALSAAAIPTGVTFESYRSPRSTSIPTPPFAATTFGDAEAYDAVYSALIAIAATPDATSPDNVAAETLQKAFLQVTATDSTRSVKAVAPSIREIVRQLRTTPEGTIFIEGASGMIKMSSTLNTTRTWTSCAVTTTGCAP